MKFLNNIEEITNHRASTKVKMRQLLRVLDDLYTYSKTEQINTFSDMEEGAKIKHAIHELYANFHYSYPTTDVIKMHEVLLEKLRLQFCHDQDAFFFPYTAILQGYAAKHAMDEVEKVKEHLLTHYQQQTFAIYHAIFSGLNINPDQDLLKTYYKAVLEIEPKNEEDSKHLEAIHEIYESLIWKKQK